MPRKLLHLHVDRLLQLSDCERSENKMLQQKGQNLYTVYPYIPCEFATRFYMHRDHAITERFWFVYIGSK